MARRDGCKGKVRHASRGNAICALKKLKNAQLTAYRCGGCRCWHLGNSRQPHKVQARISQLLKH